jgi:hypothetical protein
MTAAPTGPEPRCWDDEPGCNCANKSPAPTDEPCVCDTDFSCLANEHDKGRCDACETSGIFPLCCGEHLARMCDSCARANHGGSR